MFTVPNEMSSFMMKLSQLNSCGFNACLQFNSFEGRIYVNMSADLGCNVQNDWSETWHNVEKKMWKPSRIKRRLRRKNTNGTSLNNSDKGAAHRVTECNETETVAFNAVSGHACFNKNGDTHDETNVVLSTQSSSQELLSEESPEESDTEPGWVWTPPSDDDIRHYIEHMQAIREAEENGSKEQLVNSATTQLEPTLMNVLQENDANYSRFRRI